MADYQIRRSETTAPKEIKASAHYAYVVNGITLDGSTFAPEELLEAGLCMAKNDATGKFEAYSDGAAEAAIIIGENAVTTAVLSGIDAGTTLTIKVDNKIFTLSKSNLAAIDGTTIAQVIAQLETAADAEGNLITTAAEVKADGSDKLNITSLNEGSNSFVKLVINDGAADTATVEGVLGVASGTSDKGTGDWPEGYNSPMILDESVKFKLDDAGVNADQVVGEVLVHSAVYEGMLTGLTTAFKSALAGSIRFV